MSRNTVAVFTDFTLKGNKAISGLRLHFSIGGLNHPEALTNDFTECQIWRGETLVSYGLSRKSKHDETNVLKGMKNALGRALDKLEFDKETRKLVWDKFNAWVLESDWAAYN